MIILPPTGANWKPLKLATLRWVIPLKGLTRHCQLCISIVYEETKSSCAKLAIIINLNACPGLNGKMVNGPHLYSAFIQSAVQFMPLIHPFTHTFTHQQRLAAMQGTNQLVRSNWGLDVFLRDTSTRPGWDRIGNPPTARRQVLPPKPYRPIWLQATRWSATSRSIRQSQRRLKKVLHGGKWRFLVFTAKVVPVVQVVEDLVELIPFFKPRCFGKLLVVGRVEGAVNPTKHHRDGQFKLCVAVEGARVKDNGDVWALGHIELVKVPVKQGGGTPAPPQTSLGSYAWRRREGHIGSDTDILQCQTI